MFEEFTDRWERSFTTLTCNYS